MALRKHADGRAGDDHGRLALRLLSGARCCRVREDAFEAAGPRGDEDKELFRRCRWTRGEVRGSQCARPWSSSNSKCFGGSGV